MGIANQLQTISQGFAIVASYPELRNKPIVIGESDPDGCAACQGAQLGYRSSTMYSSYTAAAFARKHQLAEKHGVNLEGALTWAFEFEDQPYFAGFRVLASNGIDLPVLNVFRMLSKMKGERVVVKSSREVALDTIMTEGVRKEPDVSALVSLDTRKLYALVWHYHDDDVPGPVADIRMSLRNLPLKNGRVLLRQYRIDGDHSNAFALWKKLGAPQNPTPEVYEQLEKAGKLEELKTERITVTNSMTQIDLALTRQAVALLILEFK
jgi:xylan 1,4-beta-xylosidase